MSDPMELFTKFKAVVLAEVRKRHQTYEESRTDRGRELDRLQKKLMELERSKAGKHWSRKARHEHEERRSQIQWEIQSTTRQFDLVIEKEHLDFRIVDLLYDLLEQFENKLQGKESKKGRKFL